MKRLFLKTFRRTIAAVTLTAFMLATSCGGGGGNDVSESVPAFLCIILFPICMIDGSNNNTAIFSRGRFYTVGGTVSGLAGSGLVLQNNGSDGVAVGSDGAFTFPLPLFESGSYAVIVETNPDGPAQTCTASNSTGTITGADVTNVLVTCATKSYGVGGTVAGLIGEGLVLQNNGGGDLAIAANGEFAFATFAADGSGYNITVKLQPPGQSCLVSNGTGTVSGGPTRNVAVKCSPAAGMACGY